MMNLTRIRLEVAQASLEGDISAFQIAYLKLEGTMMGDATDTALRTAAAREPQGKSEGQR